MLFGKDDTSLCKQMLSSAYLVFPISMDSFVLLFLWWNMELEIFLKELAGKVHTHLACLILL